MSDHIERVTLSISANQARSGRALLGMSQAELAQAAGIAHSTVADFERGARNPALETVRAIKAVLESRGVRFAADSAVLAQTFAAILGAPLPGKPMRWIHASHLAEWGERWEGKGDLPELISRLIIARFGPAASIRFPAGESINFAGWDGTCVAPEDANFIPIGQSVWELGTQRKNIGKKAQSDYDKRSGNPQGVDPSESTFVFVTTQRWSGKTAWAAQRKTDGIWKDVRTLDADDLVHWLELYPSVGLWLAERMSRRPTGLRELQEVWEEWSNATQTPVTSEFALTDRDESASKALGWLNGQASVFSVQAESPEEVMAFFFATLKRLPPVYRLYWLGHCVVADADDVARQLIGLGPKLIVVMRGGDAGLAQRLVKDGHFVLAAYGSDIGSPQGVLRLERPWGHSLERGLRELGLDEAKAYQYSRTCGRSFTILRRIMPAHPGHLPQWAENPDKVLLAAMLAGAWQSNRPGDQRILERLAGMDYPAIEERLVKYSTTLDAPMRRSGDFWKLASLKDSWMLLARYLTVDLATRHSEVFQEVLSAVDLAYDDPDRAWKAEPEDLERPSEELRRGLIESMTTTGIFPDAATNVPNAGVRAPRAVKTLLSTRDARVWWSLSEDFRRLAEIAPSEYLQALSDALRAPEKPLEPLFRSDEGLLHPTEYLANLLWSLELLAWDENHLLQAALILAHLDEMDRAGRLGNRPRNSLRQILLAWLPQTHASVDVRIGAIDRILKTCPSAGWTLLTNLAPRIHDTSGHSPLPVWLDLSETYRDGVPINEVYQMYREVGARLLEHVGTGRTRWESLLHYWPEFDTAWRDKAIDQLNTVVAAFDQDDRQALRDTLRIMIRRHKLFPQAAWSLKARELAPLEAIFAKLEPNSAAARHRWLFESGNPYMEPGKPHQEAEEQLRLEQRKAASELLSELSVDALLAFVEGLDLPQFVGRAIVDSEAPAPLKMDLLSAALQAPASSAGHLAAGMLAQFGFRNGEAWLFERFNEARQRKEPDDVALGLAFSLPWSRETWDKMAAEGRAFEKRYWSKVDVWKVIEGDDLAFVCEKLLKVKRSRAALQLVGQWHAIPVPSELLIRILEQVVQDESEGLTGDGSMFSYYLTLTLRRLDSDPTVSESQIAALEWSYFEVLRYSDRPVKALLKGLSREPLLFVKLLASVFPPPPRDPNAPLPEPTEKERRIATNAYNVLKTFRLVPGTGDDGEIDAKKLSDWIETARSLCAELGIAEIGDQKIGEALSGAPRLPDQAWPPEAVCEVIESCGSEAMDSGFEIGIFNSRGVTVRAPFDGGAQERVLVERFRADAKAAAAFWPRMKNILERLANAYEADARRMDQSAEQKDW
jgi:transcriptional regulator with XRE-family HTH domain